MSDRPSDLWLPELKDVVIAVKGVAEWYDLGLQLGLPDADLASIAAHPDVEGHRRMMFAKWLQVDTKASWEKLANTLAKMGKNMIAADIRRQWVNVSVAQSASVAVERETKRGQAMVETAMRKIKSRFSLLTINVQESLEECKIKVKKVRQFLLTFFEGECSIPNTADLDTIFDTITEARLWRYDHYGPLEELAESFLPEDDPARGQVTEYKTQLSGFYATTKIIDFVKVNELEDRGDIPRRMFSPKKYNSHYQKLRIELRLEGDVSELTLEYVDKLWKALMKEFHLPPLTAVMDRIVEGSLRITWLVLPHIIEKIRATYFRLMNFFQKHNIVRIGLYDNSGGDGLVPLYHEEFLTGSTPLFKASFAGEIDEVQCLLKSGASVNEADVNGFTPLIGACFTGQADVAKLLLDHNADIDYRDETGWSALHHASLCSHTSTVVVLMEYGAQVDPLTDSEGTPLMAACLVGSAGAARVLLLYGANIDHFNKDGMSALIFASFAGDKETVAVLLENKALVNLVDQEGVKALAAAVLVGYADVTRMLLESGATMNFEDNFWKEYLHRASEQGFSEVMKLMLQHGAPVDLIVDEDDGNTALGVACKNGQAETAMVLLDHKARVEYQNKDGWTALLFAAQQGHLETAKLLLEQGAAIDIESRSGLTAFKVAQSEGHQDVCDLLLQHIQQGTKITTPEQEESESTQEAQTKPELNEEQQAEVKSIRERLWEQVKRVFLREIVEKELAGQMGSEQETSKRIIHPAKPRRLIFNRLFRLPRIGQRRGHRSIVGTAPAAEH